MNVKSKAGKTRRISKHVKLYLSTISQENDVAIKYNEHKIILITSWTVDQISKLCAK